MQIKTITFDQAEIRSADDPSLICRRSATHPQMICRSSAEGLQLHDFLLQNDPIRIKRIGLLQALWIFLVNRTVPLPKDLDQN
jgi:hypothetical protein